MGEFLGEEEPDLMGDPLQEDPLWEDPCGSEPARDSGRSATIEGA